MVDEIMKIKNETIPTVSGAEQGSSSVEPGIKTSPSNKSWFQRSVKWCKTRLDWSSAIFKVISSVGSVASKFTIFASPIKLFMSLTKLPKILLSPYVAGDLVVNGKKAVTGMSLEDKVKGGLKVVSNLDSLSNSVVSSVKILSTAKIISEVFERVYTLVGRISFFLSFIPLGFSIESLARIWSLNRKLCSKLTAADQACSNSSKAKVLLEAFSLIQEQGVDSLRKKLQISKTANLAERVDRLKAALCSRPKNKEAIEHATEFLKTLSGRIRQQRNWELGDTAIKVVTIVGDFFVAFTPFALVGVVILLTTAVASLVVMAGKALLIRKNPFDPNCKSKGEIFYDKLFHKGTPSPREDISQELEAEAQKVEKPVSRRHRYWLRKRCRHDPTWDLRLRNRQPIAVIV